ncbi:response regulator [Mesorhizobium sp. 128a]
MKRPVVLIVEDEPMIALDLEFELVEAGFAIFIATSCKEASEFLSDYCPDIAVLDVRLTDGECTEVATKLAVHGVPFIVHTALLTDEIDEVFLQGTVVKKPGGTPDLVDMVNRMLPQSAFSRKKGT